jgi:hypothetical protein
MFYMTLTQPLWGPASPPTIYCNLTCTSISRPLTPPTIPTQPNPAMEPELEADSYDVVVIGTGLAESIAAA